MAEEAPITPAPAPWKLKGNVYVASFLNKAGNLPSHAYSPLEANSDYASEAASGKHVGGLAMFQMIRYTDSPVGPYDELIICPGFYEYQTEEDIKGGNAKKRKTQKGPRISRIYVSQKYTCYNGRKNWNIPKHLASFDFNEKPDGTMDIKIYPHDAAGCADLTTESLPTDRPFFQASFRPQRFLPSFPLNLGWVSWLGIELKLVQPPNPGNPKASKGELPGTDRWCSIVPGQKTRRATIGWVDMRQKNEAGEFVTSVAPHENFWPGLGRWVMGIKMEDVDIDFPEGVHWDGPTTKL